MYGSEQEKASRPLRVPAASEAMKLVEEIKANHQSKLDQIVGELADARAMVASLEADENTLRVLIARHEDTVKAADAVFRQSSVKTAKAVGDTIAREPYVQRIGTPLRSRKRGRKH